MVSSQNDVFRKLIAHCKEYGLYFLPARYMMDWELCMITAERC